MNKGTMTLLYENTETLGIRCMRWTAEHGGIAEPERRGWG